MSYLEQLKANVNENLDYYMTAVKQMYDHPEIGNQEFESMALLGKMLEEKGFEVETGYVVPTGFIGKYNSGKPGPTIAYLCEYDALPEVGHGCGHNLIAGIGVGAGVALKSVIDQLGGQVWVVGTPAEENFGGKVSMAEAGVFDNVDVAMMIHPSTYNGLGGRTNALNPVKFEFFGRNAHGCRPQEGKSALDAAVLTYININLLRQFAEPNTYIHGIIREGGGAANVIPAYASMEYYFRGTTMAYVQKLTEKALKCAEAACLATGTTFKHSIYECPYDDININYGLTKLLTQSYESLGITEIEPVDEVPHGSTDMGSVSYCCPALHGYIKIADDSVTGHSKEMASATIAPEGRQALLDGATALADVGVKLLTQPELLAEIKAEFEASVKKD